MDQQIFTAILRNDLPSFIAKSFATLNAGTSFEDNWHIILICDRLRQVQEGKINRLIITMPPRSLKSICASVGFIAWVLGQDPSRKIIAVSYSDELALKLSRDCRTIMQSTWYRQTFPHTVLNPKKNTETEFETTRGGYRYSTSVGGTLTGRGGDILIIDDPMKPQEAVTESNRLRVKEWYENTLYSRLDSKKDSAIILVMQRVHMDDLVAHVLEKEHWEVLNLPAIAEQEESFTLGKGRFLNGSSVFIRKPGEVLHPNREPLETLLNIKKNIGTFNFSSQYLQAPIPLEGNLVKWAWFQSYEELPDLEGNDYRLQSWDTALTANEHSDYSVCMTFLIKGEKVYIEHVWRGKLEFPELKKKMIALKNQFSPTRVLIEDKASGISLSQELKQLGEIHPIKCLPRESKIERMAVRSSMIESGKVYLPKQASWLDALQREMMAFPQSKHDDQADTLSQALGWIEKQAQFMKNCVVVAPVTTGGSLFTRRSFHG